MWHTPNPRTCTRSYVHKKVENLFPPHVWSGPGKTVDVPLQRMGRIFKFIYARDPVKGKTRTKDGDVQT